MDKGRRLSSWVSPGALESRLCELEELRRRVPFCAAVGFACASARAPAEVVTLAPAVAITAAGMVAGFWWVGTMGWELREEMVG